ncbi:hypothetical protein TGME49_241240 [Toxoplasma gondii ME49]|uniref:Transmembrane protein n=1 Tax=Toxoplasma gondii (strain ATCC 50611 / Me49) TaxID=508771 RepID=S8GFM4_TOXGM|nr:hypothetical protein TGME49_241240 [Toxoplasma gondii ME49]EPT30640.1 hypothetical protein TGME49_241240 [Toxoplasma gondii ME49]|eukprot:XP_018637593.1 hypothetical protein TGME49_241240 [Toxoplasma gondii ME49]
MASGEMMHITTKLSILISFQCVLCTFLPERVAAQAMLKTARDPEGARGVGSSSVSVSQASSVVGTQVRRLAEGKPGEKRDPVRELVDLEEKLDDLLALQRRERNCFRLCVRYSGSFQAYSEAQARLKSKIATDPERMRQKFEKEHEEKEMACNIWAALLEAAAEKIDALDKERKNMQKRLTKKQFTRFLAIKAARGRAEVGGVSVRTASSQGAESVSTSQPPGGAGPTRGEGGFLEKTDNELIRVMQLIALVTKKRDRLSRALKKHLQHTAPSPTDDTPAPEREHADDARRAWESRLHQLEQEAEQVRKTMCQLRERRQALKRQKAAYTAEHGFRSGWRGCRNAPLRFARLGITVDETAATKPWQARRSFIHLNDPPSSHFPDPDPQPPRGTTRHVFIAGRQHLSRPAAKSGRKRGRRRAAEGSGKTGDEHKASTSTATSEPDSPGEGTSGIVAKTPTDDAAKRQRRSSPPRPRGPGCVGVSAVGAPVQQHVVLGETDERIHGSYACAAGEDSSSTSALTAVRLALLRGLQPTIPAGPQIRISTPPGGRSPGSPHSSPSPHSSRSSESSSRSESSTTATSSDDQGSGGREERTLAGATAVPASASPPGARPQTSQPMKETLLGATSPAIELPLGGATPLGLSGGSSLGTPSLGHPSRGASFPSQLSLFLRGRRIPFKSQLEIRGESYSPGDGKEWKTHWRETMHTE